ncbi:hypothetical protein [Paenibacillus eucommiae]|uniref:VOC domain-containing protein n=1 Tax=Paenibacillus eucommiae TaxID=1355755 RepID=A0ABS4IPS8_9BACL|nr:hypothetical protein [Paenibacillus eucommiae]MBP1989571.1 hypothetical protein [Paenibacillus eucommiae]
MENVVKGQVTFRNIAPIFYVTDRKLVLDYYKRLGFWCDYDMGFVEWNGIGFIVHERQTIPATPNNPTFGNKVLDAFVMVSNIDDLFTLFKFKEAMFLYELKTNEYNMREFAIKDPAGFTIGFGQ